MSITLSATVNHGTWEPMEVQTALLGHVFVRRLSLSTAVADPVPRLVARGKSEL